jgi:hypothetical protein
MEIKVKDLLFSVVGMMTTMIHFIFAVGLTAISWAGWYCWNFGIITPVK